MPNTPERLKISFHLLSLIFFPSSKAEWSWLYDAVHFPHQLLTSTYAWSRVAPYVEYFVSADENKDVRVATNEVREFALVILSSCICRTWYTVPKLS